MLHLEKRVRGEKPKSGQMVCDEDVEAKVTEELTKRDMIVLAHAIYDPTGMFLPASSALKTLYRNTILMNPSMQWKDKIPAGLVPEIRKVIKASLKISEHQVSRYALAGWGQASERLRLVCFTDAGQGGQVARIFVQSVASCQGSAARCFYLIG